MMINKWLKTLSISMSAFFILSCTTDLSDYQQQEGQTQFDIQTYFTGDVAAWGIVQDRNNKVTRRFCVEINGSWQAEHGVLAEKFYFQDGQISYRNWQLKKQGDGSYTGEAEDVVGTAIGIHRGFAFQFNYDLLLPVQDDVYQVAMDDWMYQLDEYRVINKTTMSKLGVHLANITLFFDKKQPYQPCASFNEKLL